VGTPAIFNEYFHDLLRIQRTVLIVPQATTASCPFKFIILPEMLTVPVSSQEIKNELFHDGVMVNFHHSLLEKTYFLIGICRYM
jgi:hypothetical protein